jgi:endo-alpha-1,4-polygalactosaminidase (GH114 family)
MLVGCFCTELVLSSEEYLYYLTLAQRKGIPIFTVDYALDSGEHRLGLRNIANSGFRALRQQPGFRSVRRTGILIQTGK